MSICGIKAKRSSEFRRYKQTTYSIQYGTNKKQLLCILHYYT
ncbi:MAG: hypothetical protein UR43_C0026G0002 [candidate division TM6 bacterium GW2011_GWF2_33_332]|nr:MAG: hypothetical protein UR43_C0026G0002 [candidate division TM6 bacterium GW2011_GWF2_33_332]